jgi:hypothetical protein
MNPEIKKLLDEWKENKLFEFEGREYKVLPNPSMDKEYFIDLVHTARIRIGKRSYPLKSKKRFITFTLHGEENPDRGNIVRLGWAMQELAKKFEGKVVKNIDIVYRYFEKKKNIS